MKLGIYIAASGQVRTFDTKHLEIVENGQDGNTHPFIIRTITKQGHESFFLDKSKGDYATLSINQSERILIYGSK